MTLSRSPVEGTTEYAIWSSTAPGVYSGAPAATVGQSVYSATLQGLTGGVEHYFVVRATNGTLESASSADVAAVPD